MKTKPFLSFIISIIIYIAIFGICTSMGYNYNTWQYYALGGLAIAMQLKTLFMDCDYE